MKSLLKLFRKPAVSIVEPAVAPQALPATVTPTALAALFDVKTKTAREHAPRFSRTYSGFLPGNIAIEVSYSEGYSYHSRRTCIGLLRQPGGQWIGFSPEHPAEKILDRELVPHILSACAHIAVLDAEWKPEEFIDERGVAWMKKT